MAAYALTTSAIRAALLAAALIFCAASASADPVYHLTVCGGALNAASPCFVQSDAGPPPANAFDGLDEAAFETFFNGQGLSGNEPYGWTVNGGNKSGMLFGHVCGASCILDTQFVFQNGQVLCCTIDFPFRIIGLNDNGIFIGSFDSFPFVAASVDMLGIVGLPPLDAASQQFLLAHGSDPTMDGSRLVAIDNSNRISGVGPNFGAFILMPVELVAVPEPGSALLLLAGVAMLLSLRRRLIPASSQVS